MYILNIPIASGNINKNMINGKIIVSHEKYPGADQCFVLIGARH
jgi:hypothetical protein